MGLYKRDSPFWWMAIERPRQKPLRRSTGIHWDAGSPAANKEQEAAAQRVYALASAKQVLGTVEPTKPIISFTEYATWYETHVVAHRRGASHDRSTLKQLTLWFGRYDSLAHVDAHAAEEWKTSRRKLGKAPATVNRELDVLKALMSSAAPKYLERSPLGSVRRYRVPESEPRVLTQDEEDRMFAVASDTERAWLLIAVDTLLRLSNIVNLKWAQVRAQVIVPLNAKIAHDTVPITVRMKKALEAMDRDGDFVFAEYHNGKGPTAAKNAMIRAFDGLCQKAHVPHGRQAGGVTFHCLRHTGATRALQKGASIRTVMKLGGWKDERSVIRYTHATDRDVRDAAESIGARPVLVHTPRSRGRK
jgi:integrase